MTPPREPTSDECTTRAQWVEGEMHCLAFWWPQMGGYVGKAVAAMPDERQLDLDPEQGACMEVFVWHDGKFPFTGKGTLHGEARHPVEIHVCDPGQWRRMGELLEAFEAGESISNPAKGAFTLIPELTVTGGVPEMVGARDYKYVTLDNPTANRSLLLTLKGSIGRNVRLRCGKDVLLQGELVEVDVEFGRITVREI